MSRPVALALLTAALTACTPQGFWGNEARYAPDLRGYALDPSKAGASGSAIVDPITGKKVRCREDLERLLPALTDRVATIAHDRNRTLAVGVPTIVVTIPLSGPGSLLFIAGGVVGEGPQELLYRATSSPRAEALYEQGKRALDQHRDAEATLFFERALLKARHPLSAAPDVMRAGYFLGVLYERAGRPGDAARAFEAFVERAKVRDEAAYRTAEARLAALDPTALAPCRSQEPVTFVWPTGAPTDRDAR